MQFDEKGPILQKIFSPLNIVSEYRSNLKAITNKTSDKSGDKKWR